MYLDQIAWVGLSGGECFSEGGIVLLIILNCEIFPEEVIPGPLDLWNGLLAPNI